MYFRSTLRGIAMSKIEDFENQIVTFGMRDGDLDKYAKFLRYIHEDGLKQQHCYSTALRFPPERAEQAVTLIRFGLQNFESSWFSVYTSYLSMGSIYEKAENYVKAYEAYLSANEALAVSITPIMKMCYPAAFFGRGCTWIPFAIPRKQKRITALLKEVMNFQKAFFIRNSSVKLHKS